MVGLKSPEFESEAFLKFWEVILENAKRKNAVFFMFSSEGHEGTKNDMELEDISGWLIPNELKDNFEKEWLNDNSFSYLEKWSDYFLFAEWELVNDEIIINFVDYSIEEDEK